MALPGCGDIAARASPLASVQVAEVSDQVPLPPGALAETGAQIFLTGRGTGGWSGRRSGLGGDDAAAEAAWANDATTPFGMGEMEDCVLSSTGTLAEASGEALNRSRGVTDSLSKQNSVAVDGCAAANVARSHHVTPLAEVCEMGNRVSSPLGTAAVTGARKFIRAGCGAGALSRYET